MVVVGESLFLGNAAIDFEANRDFLNLAVNWLLDRNQLLDIGPRPVNEYLISLTRSQMRQVRLLLLIVLPGSVLALGGVVWLRRRS